MKAHKLAEQLEILSSLLRSIPNVEIDDGLVKIFEKSIKSEKNIKGKIPRSVEKMPDGFDDRLRGMKPIEIEDFINSDENYLSTAQLVELANKLGISSSSRQGRNALINLIVRYFEAGQMDLIIRGTRRDDHDGGKVISKDEIDELRNYSDVDVDNK